MAEKLLDERGIPVPSKGYIETTVQQETALPARPLDAPEEVIIEREGGAFYDSWYAYDDEGTMFFATCTGDIKNNNITWAELYIVRRGEAWPIQPTYVLLPHYKIDTIKAAGLGGSLPFVLTTHTVSGAKRLIAIETGVVEGVWNVVHEPCDAEGRPYFRPGKTMTRGQAAKMITEAVGDPQPTPRQSFADVVPGSTFHTYAEALKDLGGTDGYPCQPE